MIQSSCMGFNCLLEPRFTSFQPCRQLSTIMFVPENSSYSTAICSTNIYEKMYANHFLILMKTTEIASIHCSLSFNKKFSLKYKLFLKLLFKDITSIEMHFSLISDYCIFNLWGQLTAHFCWFRTSKKIVFWQISLRVHYFFSETINLSGVREYFPSKLVGKGVYSMPQSKSVEFWNCKLCLV